jgi:uncharacterized protein (TIGR02001 family)
MKKQLLTTVVSAAIAAGGLAVPALSSASGFSANVGMVSDYRFRGMSQNDETIAIQGGFDYAHDSGFYAGTWASSLDWQDGPVGSDDTTIEVDLYAGYGGETSGGIGYDVGVLRYLYPNAASGTDYDTTEVYGSLSYSYFTASLAYSPELNFLGADNSTYFNLAGDYEFDNGVGIGASWGTFDIDEKRGQADLDYDDWKIYVAKSFGGFDFELSYVDTDEDGACKNSAGPFQCDGTAILSVSKSWE